MAILLFEVRKWRAYHRQGTAKLAQFPKFKARHMYLTYSGRDLMYTRISRILNFLNRIL